jgi:crossover junction endodeoxyribonuclease RuvC
MVRSGSSPGVKKLRGRTMHYTPIACFDLGANLGWAVQTSDGQIRSGTKKFKQKDKYSRYSAFYQFVSDKIDKESPERICYELVCRHLGVQAAHAYGAYEALLHMAAGDREIVTFGVGEIKKSVTDKGNASKQDVINAMIMAGHDPIDDNEADALAILYTDLDL